MRSALTAAELAYRRTATCRTATRRRLYRWWILTATGLVALMFLAREGII